MFERLNALLVVKKCVAVLISRVRRLQGLPDGTKKKRNCEQDAPAQTNGIFSRSSLRHLSSVVK